MLDWLKLGLWLWSIGLKKTLFFLLCTKRGCLVLGWETFCNLCLVIYRRQMSNHLFLKRNQADSFLGDASIIKLVLRFNFEFFFFLITTKTQVKLFTEEEVWFQIVVITTFHISVFLYLLYLSMPLIGLRHHIWI